MRATETLTDGTVAMRRHSDAPGYGADATWLVEMRGEGKVGEFRARVCVPNVRRAAIELLRPWGAESRALMGALRLLADHLFDRWAAHRVDLDAFDMEANVISAARRCGFAEEGRRRHALLHEGRWHDRVHFGLLEQLRHGVASDAEVRSEPAAGEPVREGLLPIPDPTPQDFSALPGSAVTLRRRRPSDRKTFYQWQCRSEWWPLWMPEDPEGYRQPSREEFDQNWRESPTANEWVVEAEPGRPLGVCFYSSLDRVNRAAEADLLLYEAQCWGHGYGTEALGLLLRHLFEDLGLHRVSSGTWSGNIGSLRVQQKNGFRIEANAPDAYLVDGIWYAGLGTGVIEDEYAPIAGDGRVR